MCAMLHFFILQLSIDWIYVNQTIQKSQLSKQKSQLSKQKSQLSKITEKTSTWFHILRNLARIVIRNEIRAIFNKNHS